MWYCGSTNGFSAKSMLDVGFYSQLSHFVSQKKIKIASRHTRRFWSKTNFKNENWSQKIDRNILYLFTDFRILDPFLPDPSYSPRIDYTNRRTFYSMESDLSYQIKQKSSQNGLVPSFCSIGSNIPEPVILIVTSWVRVKSVIHLNFMNSRSSVVSSILFYKRTGFKNYGYGSSIVPSLIEIRPKLRRPMHRKAKLIEMHVK